MGVNGQFYAPTTGERTPGTDFIGGWFGFRYNLGVMKSKLIYFSSKNQASYRPAPS